MTHSELCKRVADIMIKKYNVVLWEYQSYATGEFPDVIAFTEGYGSVLFEIKISRQDFLSDKKKDSRRNLKAWEEIIKGHIEEHFLYETNTTLFNNRPYKVLDKKEFDFYKEFVKVKVWFNTVIIKHKEEPHLGSKRYYVCEKGLIKPEETGVFGLYYFYPKSNRLKKIKESSNFVVI